jgi:hypothetical protein
MLGGSSGSIFRDISDEHSGSKCGERCRMLRSE